MNEQKMSKQEFFKSGWYLTQYDRCYMSDNAVLSYLYNQVKDIDKNDLHELLELIKDTSDQLNQLLFDNYRVITQDTISDIIALYQAINNENVSDIENITDTSLYELFNDDMIFYNYDEMVDFIDQDLKAKGVNSNFIKAYANLDHHDLKDANYILINIYSNVKKLTTHDVIQQFYDDYIIENYLKNLI